MFGGSGETKGMSGLVHYFGLKASAIGFTSSCFQMRAAQLLDRKLPFRNL